MNVIERGAWSVAIAIFVAGAFFTPQVARSSSEVGQVSPASTAVTTDARPTGRAAAGDERNEQADDAAGLTDLYGNEVTDAVATYTFDRSGSLYELHSPQTELPRLGIPKS